MLSYIYFNNKNSLNDLDLILIEIPSLPTVNEDIELLKVDGRNGSLTIKNGTYDDRVISFKFKIRSRNINIFTKFDEIYEWLHTVENNDLWFSFNNERCCKVKTVTLGDIQKQYKRWGYFQIDFICEPFMYEGYETPITLTKHINLKYTGTAHGECNIKIYGSGNIQLTINNDTVQINNVNEYVELDSKLFLCRNPNGTSKSRDMIGHFPLLIRGSNSINWIGDVTKLEILPRTAYK